MLQLQKSLNGTVSENAKKSLKVVTEIVISERHYMNFAKMQDFYIYCIDKVNNFIHDMTTVILLHLLSGLKRCSLIAAVLLFVDIESGAYEIDVENVSNRKWDCHQSSQHSKGSPMLLCFC